MMSSDAAHWEILQSLFDEAQNVTPEERERFAAEHCSNSELRERLLALLHAAEGEKRAAACAAPFPDRQISYIGPYAVRERIGTGGMGAVYLVERTLSGVTQRAALKIISPHVIGSSFLERFYREQRILASLEHPNITRMLDAGIADEERPYLVMEYVDGEHLDVWCDRQRLTVEQRLRLFLSVCEAVTYAHRNLVVHLDLKPSNILVTSQGVPKVLDFGTSKLLDATGEITATVALTPLYASPEQLRGETITTSSDVYALGVILFELLTGVRPGGAASMAALVERAVVEKEPGPVEDAVTQQAAENRGSSLSRLRSILAGDLSVIVRKCLRHSAKDRYASVHELSEDIRRYLEGLPILAQRQTKLYFFGKFVRRNSGKVAATAVMAAALFATAGYAWWNQRQAVIEGQRALRMQAFLYRLFKTANSNFTGKPAATVREFLDLGLQVLPVYIKDPADLREARLALGESIFWNGDLTQAQKVYEQVEASAKRAGDAAAEAEADVYLGDIARQKDDLKTALAQTRRAYELSRRPGVPARTRVLGEASFALARESSGQHDDATLRLWEDAVRQTRKSGLPPHENGEITAYLAMALTNRGRLAEADTQYRQALAYYGEDPLAICNSVSVLEGLANLQLMEAHESESVPLFRDAYEKSIRCAGAEDLGSLEVRAFQAGALTRAGRWQEGLPMLEAELPLWRKLHKGYGNPGMFTLLTYLGLSYIYAGRFEDAEKMGREVMAEIETLRAQLPASDRRPGLADWLLGAALAGEHRYHEAEPFLERANRNLSANARTPLARKDAAAVAALLTEARAHLSQ